MSGLFAQTVVRIVLLIVLMALPTAPAFALKPISVIPDQDRIEITSLGEVYESRGDSLQIETASALDIVAGRMTVRAQTPGTNPNWIAFALQNATDKPIERWLTADRYTMFGSGAVWPDLDARRLEAVTPSLGFVPERIRSDRADIFRITLEPGQTITYVAELSSERFARVHLWKPLDYEVKVRDKQLLNGVLLGVTGLLAVFLTAVFAANHKAIFPASALVAWCVLAHLTVDFGFFHKLFQLRPEDNAIYRAATEAAMAASLVIFLHTFLGLGRAPSLVRMLLGLWMSGQLALVAIAVIDPRLAATFARLSFAAIAVIGALLILGMVMRSQDRALSLVPTWMLFMVWVLGAAVILTGRLASDIAVTVLISGLVLIVLIMGFAVTQFAFRTLEPVYGGAGLGDQQLGALAVDGAGAAVFEWWAKRNEIKVSSVIEETLGLPTGELSTKTPDFLKHVHEADRERLMMTMAAVQDSPGAILHSEFRLRHRDNSSRWFELEATSIPGPEPRAMRFVGLLRETTEGKRAFERVVHDAVYCSLTGLPNRELFLDRLRAMMQRARTDDRTRPAILLIDIDKFREINLAQGLPVGDSLLLTLARRLQRHVTGRDTLARVGGDQFAILLDGDRDQPELAREAERVRRAVRAPIKIGGQDLVITASLGIVIHDGLEMPPGGLMAQAEIAMYRAKRAGGDRIELYHPDMRPDIDDRVQIEADLRRAVEKGQLRILYRPVIYLPTEELAGFEATASWQHDKLGVVNPATFVPVDEASDIVARVGSHLLTRAAQDAARWQKELPRIERPLFVSVNVTTRHMFRPELAREVRHILDHGVIPKGTLRLEIAEKLVMENPERAGEVLDLLDGVGAELALDEFGAGYSSIAYLHRFPFDTIKIDELYVKAAGAGQAPGGSVVRALVALAHELNKKVVASGVEDPEEAAFLRSIGCAYAQGFYYGDAMPDSEVLQLLKQVRKSEHKLQPRGFFRMTMKRKKVRTEAPVAAESATVAVSDASGSPNGSGRKPRRERAGRKSNGAARPADVAVEPVTGTPSPVFAAPIFEAAAFQPTEFEPPIGYAGNGGLADGLSPPVYQSAAYAPQAQVSAPDPLIMSLQAGLDQLQRAAEQGLGDVPPPFATAPNGLHEDLSVVFNTGGPPPEPVLPRVAPAGPARPFAAETIALLADAVGRAGPAEPALEAVRPETVTRVRPARPLPDLSKLPPGLAASLAKLSGRP